MAYCRPSRFAFSRNVTQWHFASFHKAAAVWLLLERNGHWANFEPSFRTPAKQSTNAFKIESLDLPRARRSDPSERQRCHREDGSLITGFGRVLSLKNFAAKSSRLSSTPRFRAAAINRSNRSRSALFGRTIGFVSAFAMRLLSQDRQGPMDGETAGARGALRGRSVSGKPHNWGDLLPYEQR